MVAAAAAAGSKIIEARGTAPFSIHNSPQGSGEISAGVSSPEERERDYLSGLMEFVGGDIIWVIILTR